MNENEDVEDCRSLGLGHEFHKYSETETEAIYYCRFCGKEMKEQKKPNLLTPPRRHEQ